LRAPGWRNR